MSFPVLSGSTLTLSLKIKFIFSRLAQKIASFPSLIGDKFLLRKALKLGFKSGPLFQILVPDR